MTGIVTLFNKSHAFLATDGAGYGLDGRLEHIVTKTMAIPHAGVLIAGRGTLASLPFLQFSLGAAFGSYDEMTDGIETKLPILVEQNRSLFAMCGDGSLDLVVVGWSSRNDRPSGFCIRTERDGVADDSNFNFTGTYDVEPYVMSPLGYVFAMPGPQPDVAESCPTVDLTLPADELDPANFTLRLLQMQRQSRYRYGEETNHLVGGVATLSSIDCTGTITQRVLHRWDDLVRWRIEPHPIDWRAWDKAHPLRKHSTDMSRAKRDLLARKAAKGR